MQRLVPAALAAALVCALLAAGAAPAAPPGNHYAVTPLASDVPGLAPVTESNLQNTWGLARSATSPWWIADNGDAAASVYTGAGAQVAIGGLAAQGVPGAPTGAVFSGIAGQFQVGTTASPTTRGPSNFIFDGEDGTISAWRGGSTVALVTVPASDGAVFKGLAISNGSSGPRLYATDFANGRVDVFDGSWNPVDVPGAFVDPMLPKHYAPFGIQTVGDRVFVTYAKQHAARRTRRTAGARHRRRLQPRRDVPRARRPAWATRRSVGSRLGAGVVRPLRRRPADRQLRRRADQRVRGDAKRAFRAPWHAPRGGSREALDRRAVGARVRQRRLERQSADPLLHRRDRRRGARPLRNDHARGLKHEFQWGRRAHRCPFLERRVAR